MRAARLKRLLPELLRLLWRTVAARHPHLQDMHMTRFTNGSIQSNLEVDFVCIYSTQVHDSRDV